MIFYSGRVLLVMLFIALLLASPAYARYKFTQRQVDWLLIAFEEAKKTGIPELVETTQVVLFKETLAGEWGFNPNGIEGDDGTSFGPMQNQLGTAKDVLKDFPHLLAIAGFKKIPVDKELKTALLKNVRFNVAVGAHNLKRHWLKAGREGLSGFEQFARTVQAHNRGYTGARRVATSKYLKLCLEYMKFIVRPYNKKMFNDSGVVAAY